MPFLARVGLAIALCLGLCLAMLRPSAPESGRPPPAAEAPPAPDPVADLALARNLADADPEIGAALGISETFGRERAEEDWRKARSTLRRVAERSRLVQVPAALAGQELPAGALADLARLVLLVRLLERHDRFPRAPLLDFGSGPTLDELLLRAVPVDELEELALGPASEDAAAEAARTALARQGGSWTRLDPGGPATRIRVTNPRGEPFTVTVDGFTTVLAEGVRDRDSQEHQDQARPEVDFTLVPRHGPLELVLATRAWPETLHLVLELPGAAAPIALPVTLPVRSADGAAAKSPRPGDERRLVVRLRIPAALAGQGPGTVRFRALGLQPLAATKVTRRIDYLLQRTGP